MRGIDETQAILSVPNALAEIAVAEAEIDAGDYVTAAQLHAKYLTTE